MDLNASEEVVVRKSRTIRTLSTLSVYPWR